MLYKFGNYTLNADRCELRLGADRIELEPQVFSVLGYLIQERSRIVTRGDLIATIWNGRIVSDSTINSRIAAARRVIGDEGRSQSLIRSFPRRGYRFVAPVETEAQQIDIHGAEKSGSSSGTALHPRWPGAPRRCGC